MAWEFETGVISGTGELFTKLADWLDSGSRNWSADADKVHCDATVRGVPGVDTLQLCHGSNLDEVKGSTSHPRWSASLGSLSSARQGLWRFQKRGGGSEVDFWMVVDNDQSPANMGIFCLITADLNKAANQFGALFSSGHPDPVVSNNLTAPRFASVYPALGGETYYFFSDGHMVHVAFRRTTAYGVSWQHFSFGTIRKASSAWVGGEYFSGCCAGAATVDGWDYASNPDAAARKSTVVLSSPYRKNRFESSATEPDCHAKGLIRVVGVADADSTFTATRTVNYCALGDLLNAFSTVTGLPTTTSNDRDAVGSVAVLGGLSAYQQIVGSTSATADPAPLNFQELCPNSWDRRAPGTGVDLLLFDYLTTSRWQLLGSVDGIRFVNAEFLAEESVVNTDWVVLPVSTAGGANVGGDGNTNWGTFGIAYRKMG